MARRPRRPAGPSTAGGYQPGSNPGGGAPTQPISVAPGGPYGERKQLTGMQQQQPLPAAAPTPTPAAGGTPVQPGGGMQAALQAALATRPPGGTGLLAPTARPAEPVTAGLPVGPGAGPEILGGAGAPTAGPTDQILANLYRAYQIQPTEGLRQLIAKTEQLRGRSL